MTSHVLSEDTAGLQEPIVLITRPEGQQQALANGCTALGFSVQLLPCLKIIPCKQETAHLQSLLDSHRSILFTSANAVSFAHRIVPFPWKTRQVHAIGAATANALGKHKQPIALTPRAPYTSEAYLEQLKHLPADSLLIVKGVGGRELIQTTLATRHWQTRSIDVYERIRPDYPLELISTLFKNTTPDIICIGSDQILTNLWHFCQPHKSTLQNIPLIVNSERCANLAKTFGFTHTSLVASPAGDTGQLHCLAQWKKTVWKTTG